MTASATQRIQFTCVLQLTWTLNDLEGTSGPDNIIGGNSGRDVEVFDFVDFQFLVLHVRTSKRDKITNNKLVVYSMLRSKKFQAIPLTLSMLSLSNIVLTRRSSCKHGDSYHSTKCIDCESSYKCAAEVGTCPSSWFIPCCAQKSSRQCH